MKQLNKEWQLKDGKLEPSDPKKTKLRFQMNSLDEKWNSVKTNAEDYHQMLNEKIAKWNELEDRNNNIYESLRYLEVNFEGAEKTPLARQKVVVQYCLFITFISLLAK